MIGYLVRMSLELDPQTTVVGRIEIVLYLDDDGVGTTYSVDGIANEAALGYLMIVSDRIREERKYEWDTCPDCGHPWSEHDEDPELYDQEDDE